MSAPVPDGPGDCLFCRIVRGEVPARVLFENELVLAFEDIRPQAPVHALVVPKAHFASLDEAPDGSEALLGEVLFAAREVARSKGVGASGYRVVLNTGRDSGQEVFHIHFHVIGGRRLAWPPG